MNLKIKNIIWFVPIIVLTSLLANICPGFGQNISVKAGDNGNIQVNNQPSSVASLSTKIVYSSSQSGNSDIYTMHTDGTNIVQLTTNLYGDVEASFSPDGTKIVYATETGGPNMEIFVMNLDGTNKTNLTNNPANDSSPSLSPDGTKIVFVSNRNIESTFSIYVMNFDGSDVIRLTNDSVRNVHPAWSPDSTKIIFCSERDINPAEIYVMNADGTDVERLTVNADGDSYPSWSPDGTKIAFSSNRDSDDYVAGIYLMNLDGSNQTRLCDGIQPCWSPDGKEIAYVHSDNIYTMHSDGSNPIKITRVSQNYGNPSWSPASWNPSLVRTEGSSDITVSTATLKGYLVDNGSDANVSVSFDWGLEPECSEGNIAGVPLFLNSPGEFLANLTGLTPSQTYYYRARTDGNNEKVTLGESKTFTTLTARPLELFTHSATNISSSSVKLNAILTSLGQAPAVQVSFEYGLTPYFGNSTPAQIMSEPGVFSADLTGLTPNTIYFFRAIADGGNFGYSHGDYFLNFTTQNIFPTVATNPVTNVETYSAVLNGNVLSLGGYSSVMVYFEFGTSGYETGTGYNQFKTETGAFNYKITHILPNTLYHYRAVVDMMHDGKVYGEDMTFTTLPAPPDLVTTSVSNLSSVSATLSAKLTSMGSAKAVNVCFEYGATTQYGTTTSVQRMDYPDSFKTDIAGLTSNMIYHFRARADGGASGTALGNDMTIFTGDIAQKGKIAFTSEREGLYESKVYVMNVDGSEQTKLTGPIVIDHIAARDFAPSCSPDGSKIAFYSSRGMNYDIYTVDLKGNMTRLTTDPNNDTYPAWSPDGNKIAFVSNRDENREIYIMNIDGSKQTRLTNNTIDDLNPRWLPDGSLAFNSQGETYLMNADGSNVRLFDGPDGVWSPDGNKIAFSSSIDGYSEIYVADFDGSNPIKLTNCLSDNYHPTWSPDSMKIAFISNRDDSDSNNTDIYTMRVDGSNQTRITLDGTNSSPSWAISEPWVALVTTSLPNGYSGIPYSQYMTATGGLTPYTWTIKSGALPAGLTLDKASGVISGKPFKAKTYNFTVKVTDSSTPGVSATQPLSIAINPALKISTATLPAGYTYAEYLQNMVATGGTGSYTWSLVSGTLPDGFDLNIDGELRGTPEEMGTFSFYVQVDDGLSSVSKPLTLNIYTPLVITPASLPNGDARASYSVSFSATGGVSPYKWSKSGNWPKGLILSSKGVIRGKPAVPGIYDFIIKVTDKAKNITTESYSIKVNSAVTLTYRSLTTGEVNIPYLWSPSASGGDGGYTWSYKGTLLSGLSFDNNTGVISGTPIADVKNAAITVKVTDGLGGFASKALKLKIYKPVAIVTDTLKDGKAGTSYSVTIKAKDGSGKNIWLLAEGSNPLPDWASLNPKRGVISTKTGSKPIAGTWEFSIVVTDTLGGTDTKSFAISIR